MLFVITYTDSKPTHLRQRNAASQGVVMYSEEVLALFKKQGIEIGDIVSISSSTGKFEGEIMPKTGSGDDNIIVLKLKSGYNAGILYGKDVKVEKIASGKHSSEIFEKELKRNPLLPDVTILWTGGTIGSKVGYRTGGVEAKLKPGELLYYIPELAEIANITLKHIFNIWSDNMTVKEWQKIAVETANSLKEGANGVVITHGTDTMHYTGAALSFMLQNLNAPVVLTGAQRSSDRGSSDAFMNLICAVHLAAKSDIAEVGICMHAKSSDDKCAFLRGTKARKMHSSRRDAFRSINSSPIATVNMKGDIQYIGNYRKRNGKGKSEPELATKFEPKVALIKAYPNSDPEIIDYYVKNKYKGIIIEGTGLGHFPTSGISWLPGVKKAVDKGVIVGMTTQCINGRVNANVYEPARMISRAGVVYCEDMLPETAYIKLGWLLANKPEQAKELLPKDLAGEITPRIEYEENFD